MAIVTPIETPPGERRRLRLSSPATGEPLHEITVANADDVRAAVERARKAQPAWAELGPERRVRYLRRALDALLAKQEEIVATVMRESGKPRTEALQMEVFAACDALNYWARRAPRWLRPRKRRLHGVLRFTKQLRIVYRPLGVIGVISPWNGPFILSLNPAVQALAAGNSVVIKPSEVTPHSGKLVADLFEAAGLPEGVLQVVLGDGETGAALIEAGIDKLAFTGSVTTGRKVAEACAKRLIPCVLELGGKDPMIVCEDADLDSAAGGAVAGGFLNTGQYCCGTERVYVVDEVADEFVRKVVERAGALRQGASGEFDVGPLFWPRQLEIVEEHVQDALAKGARALVGGRRNPALAGLYFEPTVLVDVTHDMKVMREETFGPVLAIVRVRDEEEALRLANDSRYGLSANVWTRSRRHGVELAGRIESGSVCVNDMAVTFGVPEAPFGGLKQSGIGVANGDAGVRSFCHALPIIIDRFGGRQTRDAYPYSFAKDAVLQRVIRFLFGTTFGRWLG
jgi:succinate-semialdehyde dehydrogenase/glutarate-semialdehyde dehydrogenase